MSRSNGGKRLKGVDFLVSSEDRPDWPRASDRTPLAGETVYCAGGPGTLVSVHGRTGDGSRLLEIRLDDDTAPPYFAAASNVLLQPQAKPKASRRRGSAARQE